MFIHIPKILSGVYAMMICSYRKGNTTSQENAVFA